MGRISAFCLAFSLIAASSAIAASSKDDKAVNALYDKYEREEGDYYAGKISMEQLLEAKKLDYAADVVWVPPFQAPALLDRATLFKTYEKNTRPAKEAGDSTLWNFRVAARKWLDANNAIDVTYAKARLISADPAKEVQHVYMSWLIVSRRNPDGSWSWQAGSATRTKPEVYEQAHPVPGARFDR